MKVIEYDENRTLAVAKCSVVVERKTRLTQEAITARLDSGFIVVLGLQTARSAGELFRSPHFKFQPFSLLR